MCVPPGTYKALTDIDINIDGVSFVAPSGATIRFANPSGLQFFIRGNGNTVSSIAINCAGTPFSGEYALPLLHQLVLLLLMAG